MGRQRCSLAEGRSCSACPTRSHGNRSETSATRVLCVHCCFLLPAGFLTWTARSCCCHSALSPILPSSVLPRSGLPRLHSPLRRRLPTSSLLPLRQLSQPVAALASLCQSAAPVDAHLISSSQSNGQSLASSMRSLPRRLICGRIGRRCASSATRGRGGRSAELSSARRLSPLLTCRLVKHLLLPPAATSSLRRGSVGNVASSQSHLKL